jgi:hypothetical protein
MNSCFSDRAAVSLIGQERRHRAKDASVVDATKRWKKTATYR